MLTATLPTADDYARVFEAERLNEYPAIDAFEARMGYALDRVKLEAAARVLACPVKAHAPNWQHGRVIYAAARRYFATQVGFMNVLDVGTAKGFSALCLHWAMTASGRMGQVTSVDVLDPLSTSRRNTVAEAHKPITLAEMLLTWLEAQCISCHQMTGVEWLESRPRERVRVAFIDGKHQVNVAITEGRLLADRQQSGDLSIFDDLQLIAPAVDALERAGLYAFERLSAKPGRAYAIGVRK